MPAQQRHKGRVEKALVTDLDRVMQLAPAAGQCPSAAGEALVVPFGEGRRLLGVPRQQGEEMFEARRVEPEARRELPQEGALLLIEAQHAGGEEIGERRLDIAQLLQMRDEPAALDGEDKALRSLVTPSGEGFGALQRVVGAVDLDGVDLPAREGQLIGMPQPGRIEAPAPAAIGPAGDADPDLPGAAHRPSSRGCAMRPGC